MDLNWRGSSLILTERLLSELQGMECSEALMSTVLDDNGVRYLSPYKTNIYIADEERLRDSKTFREIVKYYETKVEPSRLEAFILIVSDESIKETKVEQITSIDTLFSALLKEVYFEIDGISSIAVFPYSVIREICSKDKNEHPYLSFLLEFISLFCLSTRAVYDDSSKKYQFQIGSKIDSEFRKSILLETDWNDTTFFKSKIFSTIATWVLDNKGIPDGQHLRRSVAQNYILGFEDSSEILLKTQEEILSIPHSLDNMFESVLNARSEKYIQNINKMKDDYIDSYNQYSQILASANTQTISNIFALTAAVYGLFFTKEALESPVTFFSFKIVLGFFFVTTLLILIIFRGNLKSLNNSKSIRRKYYSVMLGVTDEKLERINNRISPELPTTWHIPLITLILILFILFILIVIPETYLPKVIQGFFT